MSLSSASPSWPLGFASTPWLPWARKRLSPEWLAVLSKTGGGDVKARTWFLYFGTIPPARFRSVTVRGEDGAFTPAPP